MSNQYLGKRRFKDLDTGEIIEMDYIKKSVGHSFKKGWRRIYLADFLSILDEIGNAKIKVMEFILDSLDSNNKLTLSIADVARKVNITYKTVHTTFKALEEKKLIKKIGTAWVVMPDIVSSFGSDAKNARLLTEYTEEEATLFDGMEALDEVVAS